MSPVTLIVLAGAVVGVGVWMVWSGWSPARPSLVDALARINRPVQPLAGASLDARVGAWARRLTPVERALVALRADLRVLRRSPDEQAALMLVATLCGLLWAPVVAGIVRVFGFVVPLAVPLWLGLIGATTAGALTIRHVRTEATRRRREFSVALGAFCDIAGLCLASGRGVDGSIQTAANAGRSWPFAEIKSALQAGYVNGQTPWHALGDLAEDCHLPDLAELASALSLCGDEGAAVRDTVASKARAIRERLTSDAERDAAAVTERMGIPGTVLLFGFVVFLGFPALSVIF